MIIGVAHMLVGIILKGCNAVFFKNWIDFFFEVLPQFLFLLCTFGYMDFLIIYKWLTPNCQASIITTMINMILNPTALPNPPMFEDPKF